MDGWRNGKKIDGYEVKETEKYKERKREVGSEEAKKERKRK